MAAHILFLPHPAQGHINPTLAFAKQLASMGVEVTFIITTELSKKASFSAAECAPVAIAHISDGAEEVKEKETETFEAIFVRLRRVLSASLAEFIDNNKRSASPAKLVVYDSTMPWVLDVVHQQGLLGAPFFTNSGSVTAIFYHLKQGLLLKFPYEDDDVSLPFLPRLAPKDLPALSFFMDSNQTVLKLLLNQFLNLDRADWIFINTFHMLEQQIIEWMESKWAMKSVGPTFLLEQKGEKCLEKKHKHSINLFEATEDGARACREWLDARDAASVVYVSFGSFASLGKEQMEEVAQGLLMSNCYFLWVVRSSEVEKLPAEFRSSAEEKGLIVEWCHQREVLAHPAVGCFVTHCGWNSTLEGLSSGVPMVAMPQWVDQNTNAKFVADVWGVGVGVRPRQDGIVGREEIAMCVQQVVRGETSLYFKKNASEFKRLAHQAVQCGGTSATNIQHFLSKLFST